MLSGFIPSVPRDLLLLEGIDFNFNFNNLSGHIPEDMFDHLPNLKELALSVNLLSGRIPASLFKCKELQKLSLSYNQMEGSLPIEIGNLSMLQSIYIGRNHFEGNQLSGHLPSNMGLFLPKMEELYLGVNHLVGSFPMYISNASQLTLLDMLLEPTHCLKSQKRIQRLPDYGIYDWDMLVKKLCRLWRSKTRVKFGPAIHNTKRILDYVHSDVRGPTKVASLGEKMVETQTGRKVKRLRLDNGTEYKNDPFLQDNTLGKGVIEYIDSDYAGDLDKQRSTIGYMFTLAGGPISWKSTLQSTVTLSTTEAEYMAVTEAVKEAIWLQGSIPDNLGNLRNLKILNLENNNLTSSGMSFLFSLTNCRVLEKFIFNRNPFISAELPRVVGNLSSSLELFSAYSCNIKGSIPSEIENLSHLIDIELGGNKLIGPIPTTIGGLQELQSLSFEDNKLEGSIPSELCHLNKLAFLFFTNNKLSGPIPACLSDLTSLRQLFLDSNVFSSSIPSTLTRLNYLLILYFSSNSLSGPLPIDIGKWKVLTSLDLSNNQFSGDIPNGVADLKDLTHFSLSNNRIMGSILESFDELLSLEFLDMSRNNLSGEIPKSLEKLCYLKYFNVSFNRLEGEIPERGSFGNYSIESFKGNEALCGAARLHVPNCKTRPLRNSKAKTKLKLIIYIALPIASTILVVALIIIILRNKRRKDKLPTQEDMIPLGTWRRFSYHELRQATDGFNDSRLLGNGSYGSVFQGALSNGTIIAVKVFKLELEGAFKSFDVECDVLRNTRHRNLVKVISSCSNDLNFKALVLEFMPNGSLDKWLYSTNQYLDILQRLNIMIDVASALEYLHHGNATPVVHCDLKPNNVLLDEDIVAHLSGFGIAKLLCEEVSMIQTMTMATFGYMAPEYGVEEIVSTKDDVYSFGILLMEIITRKKPTDEMFAGERSLKSWDWRSQRRMFGLFAILVREGADIGQGACCGGTWGGQRVQRWKPLRVSV
ncbi:receptor kinase-like protein Xa21 [Gossypium arboreum]|uniref:receptor kinase-like protein Xa21 n=1 Tax=Gossypium arboreum TaxID=29729 RepID=UPI0022F1BA66|nr:receptor kinase-like protein Xa21 [Gossypium arboreum]